MVNALVKEIVVRKVIANAQMVNAALSVIAKRIIKRGRLLLPLFIFFRFFG
jgi:hypothetical protein